MATVYQVLRDSGFTDAQIADLDQGAVQGFSRVLTTAEAEHQAAEQARRDNASFYESQVAPSLNQWGSEKAKLEAEAAYYKTLAESARASGFIPPADPPGVQPRDAGGRYVAGQGSTPGSPGYVAPAINMDAIDERLGNGVSNVAWALQTYQQLNPGEFLPDSFDKLAQEAHISRLPFRQYVEAKYNFQGKRQEQAKKQQDEHDAKIVKEVETRKDREWAEKVGSNPDMRMPMRSPAMTDIARATAAGAALPGAPGGKLNDPLLLSEHERRQQTRAGIRTELMEAER